MLPASAQSHSFGYIEPFEIARRIAKRIDPTANLDYIPYKERGMCEWIDDKILHDPTRGDLMWVGSAERPESIHGIRKTKLFICRQCVSSDIHDVVLKSKERWQHRNGVQWSSDGRWYIDHELVEKWVADARKECMQQVGESWDRCIDTEDWKKAYEKVCGGLLDRKSFMEWLDQRAWDRGMEGSWGTPSSGSDGGEADMEELEEEGEVPASSSDSVYNLDMGWERLEAALERGLGGDF